MQDMHKNDIDDLRIRMENEENNRDAKIYLHNLSLKPFPIFSVSKKQISVLKKLKEQKGVICVNIDTTAKIVKSPVSDDEINYTVIVINIKNIDDRYGSNLPLMEILSSKNTFFKFDQCEIFSGTSGKGNVI